MCVLVSHSSRISVVLRDGRSQNLAFVVPRIGAFISQSLSRNGFAEFAFAFEQRFHAFNRTQRLLPSDRGSRTGYSVRSRKRVENITGQRDDDEVGGKCAQ